MEHVLQNSMTFGVVFFDLIKHAFIRIFNSNIDLLPNT